MFVYILKFNAFHLRCLVCLLLCEEFRVTTRVQLLVQFININVVSLWGENYLNHTEFILVRLCRKLLSYRSTLKSVPGTNQYWAMRVKFFAQGNNELSLTGFEPIRLAILKLLVRHVNHSTTPPLLKLFYVKRCSIFLSENSVHLHVALSPSFK